MSTRIVEYARAGDSELMADGFDADVILDDIDVCIEVMWDVDEPVGLPSRRPWRSGE